MVSMRALMVGARGFVDGLSPGQGGVEGKETFEGEDGHLEEVKGEPGDDAGEDKGKESANDVIVVAGVGVGDPCAEIVEDWLEQDMEDVEAVTDASEPGEGRNRKDRARKAVAEEQRDGRRGGDADGGEAEPELEGLG